MVIKKYIAATENEAIALAKAELGEDVTIMNIKENNPKGLSKLFKKSSVEVTAAVDDVKKEQVRPESKLLLRILKSCSRHLMPADLNRHQIQKVQGLKKIKKDLSEIIR